MLLFSICLLCLVGISLITFAVPHRKPPSVQSVYAMPPTDLPDVPASDLGLYQREGRINASMPKPRHNNHSCPKADNAFDIPRNAGPPRLTSFEAAQDLLVGLVDPSGHHVPHVALALSDDEGPSWTDVILDGAIVARVPTAELAQRSATYGARP